MADDVPLNGRDGEQKRQPWDIFKNTPRKTETGSAEESRLLDFGKRCLKILTIIVTFAVVLGTAVVSKITLFLMTSHVRLNISRPYCNKYIDDRQQFFVTLPSEETTVWIWMVIFAFCVPEIGTFLRSVRICLFKTWMYPEMEEFIFLCLAETLPTVGSALLVFVVFPDLDVIKAAMLTNAVCFVPAVLAFFSKKPSVFLTAMNSTLNVMAIIAQATAMVAWPIVEGKTELFIIPVAIILISYGWARNYMPSESIFTCWRKSKAEKKTTAEEGQLTGATGSENYDGNQMEDEDDREDRKCHRYDMYFMFCIIAPIKCVVFIMVAVLAVWVKEGDATFMFTMFDDAFQPHELLVNETAPNLRSSAINYQDALLTDLDTYVVTSMSTPLIVLLINVLSTYLCYAFGKFACKIMVQTFGFAVPINLTVPVLVTVLIAMIGNYYEDVCAYADVIPPYLFFNVPPMTTAQTFLSKGNWVWLLWLLSQTWITWHIWTNKNEKLASTEKIFMRPMYDPFLVDQSLAMNRRRTGKSNNEKVKEKGKKAANTCDVKVYACGTMWHETKEEMVIFLKSIIRMDADQCSYRLLYEHKGTKLDDYYEFETHVLFDEAFKEDKEDKMKRMQVDNLLMGDKRVNKYVQCLIDSVEDAVSEVHGTNLKPDPPVAIETPYGGRIVWTLPGRTNLVVHLKDDNLIRKKKRWSQVMYMYYLLGFRIMSREGITPEQVNQEAMNTFILALDGDIDFQPEAVKLLLDYMKKDETVGAACGRIHPVGAGAMTWYQIFEYAVGHWLQKATEHVIGCVLCSPGCFSLFRAEALMADGVMAKYTTESREPMHCVQYDQGEDRWLCTLLLQKGFRVEYSAASDAYTHCPEGFNEFYNQRRRWMPSTTANIMDLLSDRKNIIRVNDNISWLYIAYQMILMIGTVLGPGTIFLMLVGAFVSAFKLSQWDSFMWNSVPILLFVIVCATCKSETQLFFASIISGIYGLVMMAVLVGILLQIKDDGFFAPSSLFFFFVAMEFILTALMHPQEFYCLKYGVIYYVTVPSMYLLLVIYSVFNMNDISWGTRVTKESAADKPQENVAQAKKGGKMTFGEKRTEKLNAIQRFLRSCCDFGWSDREIMRDMKKSLEQIAYKLDAIERAQYNLDLPVEPRKTVKRVTIVGDPMRVSRLSMRNPSISAKPSIDENIIEDYEGDEDSQSFEQTDDSWLDTAEFTFEVLDKKEEKFWEDIIKRYLSPLNKDDPILRDITIGLKDLRDKVVMTFFMLNSLFVLTVFLLTLQKDVLHINWPFDPKVNFTYRRDLNEFTVQQTYLQLEPIGLVFLVFFFLLMGIQFFGMLKHRFGTFCQIMANTSVELISTAKKKDTSISKTDVNKLMTLREPNEAIDGEQMGNTPARRRKTAGALVKEITKERTPKVFFLDDAYYNRIEGTETDQKLEEQFGVARKTLHDLRSNRRPTQSNVSLRNSRPNGTLL